jgi:hypothetical protein
MAGETNLTVEARAFGGYLLGSDPPEESIRRYAEANRTLFPDPPDGPDATLVAFVLRHPWSLGPLESAAGLLRPRSRLRRKLVVMLAILETDPTFSDRFEAHCPGRPRAVLQLPWLAVRSGAKLLAGIPLYPIARLSRRAAPAVGSGEDE